MIRFGSGQRYVRYVMSFTAGLLLITGSLFAQTISGGSVVGKVTDASGSAVPGVTVTLTGIGAPQVFVTTSTGDYRFLNLSPGNYHVKAELAGFAPVERPVVVSVGANSEINFNLQTAVSESVTVTAESPVIDVRSNETGSNVPNI